MTSTAETHEKGKKLIKTFIESLSNQKIEVKPIQLLHQALLGKDFQAFEEFLLFQGNIDLEKVQSELLRFGYQDLKSFYYELINLPAEYFIAESYSIATVNLFIKVFISDNRLDLVEKLQLIAFDGMIQTYDVEKGIPIIE